MQAFLDAQVKVLNHVSVTTAELQAEQVLSLLTVEKSKVSCKDPEAALLAVGAASLTLLGDSVQGWQSHQREVFSKKNSDYGASYKRTGVVGILVRIVDKLSRLESLNTVTAKVTSESQRTPCWTFRYMRCLD